MRIRWRKHAAVLIGLGVAASLAACSSGGGGAAASTASSGPLAGIKLVNPGYLTVAMIAGNLPAIAQGPGDTLIGGDGAWVDQAAKDLGLKIKTFPTTLSGQILAVQDGKADIGTSTHYTAARARQIFYTFPWSVSKTGVITKKGFNYTGPNSLNGQKVGTETGLDYVPYAQKAYGQGNVQLYGGVAQLNAALENGQITAEVSGYQSYLTYLKKYPDFEWHFLSAGQMDMPQSLIAVTSHNFVNCNNRALATALNKTLTKMHANGTMKAALLQYGDPADANDPPPLQAPTEVC
jgi:ABC-type amino acid transport substrate-binding protein